MLAVRSVRVCWICWPFLVVWSPTWSTLAWIGAVVVCTYFLVAQPPVSSVAARRLALRKVLVIINSRRVALQFLRRFARVLTIKDLRAMLGMFSFVSVMLRKSLPGYGGL